MNRASCVRVIIISVSLLVGGSADRARASELLTAGVKGGWSGIVPLSGKYNSSTTTFHAATLEASLNHGPAFDVYCVDLAHHFGIGDSWQVDVVPIGDLEPYGDGIGWLYHTYAASVSGDRIKGASLQTAIWDMVTDGGDGLSKGNFQVSALGSADQESVYDQATLYLSAYGTSSKVGPGSWLRATSHPNSRNQDFVGLAYGPAVPEPAAFTLIATGLAFGAIVRRRTLIDWLCAPR